MAPRRDVDAGRRFVALQGAFDVFLREAEILRLERPFGELAVVVGDLDRTVFARALLDRERCVDGQLPLVLDHVDLEELLHRFEVEGRRLGELPVGGFRAVVEPRGEVVEREFAERLDALLHREVLAVEEMLMEPHRALEVAAAAVELPEAVLELRRVGVEPHGFREGLDQKERHAARVALGGLIVLELLLRFETAGEPTRREEHRDGDEVPEFEIHGTRATSDENV